MLHQMYDSNLISHLMSLNAKSIIIFGSAIKGDWYKNSDIDIFILSKAKKPNLIPYEKKLKRNIEIHQFKSKKEIDNIRTGLFNNILDGYIIKGSISEIIEV